MIAAGLEQVLGEFRQLAGTEQRLVAHQHGRADLGIAVLAGVDVKHELAERAFEPRQRPGQDHEARARHPGGRLEIHHAQRLAKRIVLLGFEIEALGLAPFADLDIGAFIAAVRHVAGRDIR